jgi:phage terminase Nu1 subunit (DNA packaging protein)
MSKTPIIVVDSGELYLLGKLISRHTELPWLFSITDVYKACEKSIKREAVRKGKKPETYFKTRAPGQWLRTKDEDGIKRSASATRKRLIKYGINCGFGSNSDVHMCTSLKFQELTANQLVIKTVKGNFKDGSTQGTYVCQNWIVQYASFLNEALSEEITTTFTSVLNGHVEEVTKKVEKNERIAKGTQARQDNKDLNSELVEACGRKHLLPMKVQQGVNEGVLGMSATKYKKLHDIKEPFNDNLTQEQIYIKNIGINIATYRIHMHKAPRIGQKEGNMIGITSGQRALKLAAEYE